MLRALPFLLVPLIALGATPEVERARRLFYEHKLSDAGKAVEAGLKVSGNPRDAVVDLLELKGIVLAEQNQEKKATEAFLDLLELDPVHELTGKYPGKVTSAFVKARKQQGEGLEVKAAKAGLDNGRVIQLAVKVKNDERHLVQKVLFHVVADGAAAREESATVQSLYAAVSLDAAGVQWWAEVLGDDDALLAKVGSAEEPVSEGAAAAGAGGFVKTPPRVASEKPPEKVAATQKKPPPDAPTEKKLTPSSSAASADLTASEGQGSAARPLGYVLLGLGAAAVGVGVYFGVTSNNERSRVSALKPDGGGLITSLTQKEAFALDASARTDALVADVLFGAGGALALTGALLWFFGGPSDASVALLPVGNGAVLSGQF